MRQQTAAASQGRASPETTAGRTLPKGQAPQRRSTPNPSGKDNRMMRKTLLVLAGLLAVGGIGCAHCDTCDDFPLNCASGNCGANSYMPSQLAVSSPAPAGPSELMAAPPVTSQPGPFNPNDITPSTRSSTGGAAPATPAPSTPAAGGIESPPAAPAAPGGANKP